MIKNLTWSNQTTVAGRLRIAAMSVASALALGLLLRQWMDAPYWFLFLIAGITSAWTGGRIAGWTAVVLSTLIYDYFFIRPYYSFVVAPGELIYFIAFAVSMLFGNWFGTYRKNADALMRRARDTLASRVEKGAIELEKINETLRAEVISREQAENERRISEQRWQAVFASSVIGMVLADDDGRIISANRRFMNLIGAEEDAIKGHGIADYVTKPLRTSFHTQFAELLDGKKKRIDLEVQHQFVNASPRWLRFKVALVSGSPEFSRFVIAFCDDISEHKAAEEALLGARAELAHASRLTVIGELAASIAHEVNQPLSAIVTNCNACLRWLAGQNPNLREADKTLNWIMRDAKRASEVITRIRALMRKGDIQREAVDFNEIVYEGLDMMQNELDRQNIWVTTELESPLPPVHGERVQLQQVFLNLVINAIEAMADVIERPRQLFVKSSRWPGSGSGITIEVRDNGTGVEQAHIDKLFAAFFTTKAEGTGLGLWISRSIVESHEGELLPVCNPDHGMSFCIVLPCEPSQSYDTSSIAGDDLLI
jgi:PAS domain S-box-containing protein